MRTSTQLVSNATTTYLRLGTTFVLGVFTTWYMVGTIGVVGFGLLGLASSSTGVTRSLELALQMGLVRELADAIASGDTAAIRRSFTSAFRLCLKTLVPLVVIIVVLALAAGLGFFNLPGDGRGLAIALIALIVGEGLYAGARLLSAPYVQSLFAAQKVGLDNLLAVVGRVTYALSAVVVFGWLLPGKPLAIQLVGYAVSRATLQLSDVVLGIWLAKRLIPGLSLDREVDRDEYRSVRSTVWHSSQVELLLNLSPQYLAIVINLFFGLTYNGLWQIVVQLSGYLRMFSDGLLRGIAPLTTHLQRSGRSQALLDLMARTIRYQLAFAVPAAVVLGLFVEPVLHLWVGGRLADDPQLSAAGLSLAGALGLAADMTLVMLVARTVRSSFFGVERILYGMGRVRSYSWFSKWALLLSVLSSTALMYWMDSPMGTPLGLLLGFAVHSLVVVPLAARRTAGLPVLPTLRRSMPSPLAANLLFFAVLVPVRFAVDRLSMLGLLVLLAGAAMLYGLLAIGLIAEADERKRLAQLLRSALRRLQRGRRSQSRD